MLILVGKGLKLAFLLTCYSSSPNLLKFGAICLWHGKTYNICFLVYSAAFYHVSSSRTEDVDRYNLYVEGACLSGVKETTQDIMVRWYSNQ